MAEDDLGLERTLDRLHEQALRSIRTQQPVVFGDISRAYGEVVLAFPQAWALYAPDVAASAAGSQDFLLWDAVSHVRQLLYEELVEAVRSGNRELSLEAIRRHYRIANGAFKLGSLDLSESMINLLVSSYGVVRGHASVTLSDLLAGHVRLLLFQFLRLEVLPRARALDEEGRTHLEFLVQLFHAVGHLMKSAIEFKDAEEFIEADAEWSYVSSTFAEPLNDPFGDDQPAMGGTLTNSAELREQTGKQWEFLSELRSGYRFILLYWALREAKDDVVAHPFASIVQRLITYVSDAEAVIRQANLALRLEWGQRRAPLSDWIWDEMRPRADVHAIGSDLAILEVTILLLLSKADTGGLRIPPQDWIKHRLETLLSLITSARSEDPRWELLGRPTDLESAKSYLADALRIAAEEQGEAESREVAETPLDSLRKIEFEERIVQSWEGSRIADKLIQIGGGLVRTRPVDSFVGGRVVSSWVPRDILVEPPLMGGMDTVASSFGRVLAQDELQGLIKTLEVGPRIFAKKESFLSVLLATCDEMRAQSVAPTIVLKAMDWELDGSLNVETISGPLPRWEMSSSSLVRFVGFVSDLPVFETIEIRRPCAFVVAVPEFLEWQQDLLRSERGLLVELKQHTPEEAVELVDRHPSLFKQWHGNDERRALEVRRNVLVSVSESFGICVNRWDAARCVELEAAGR